MELPGPSIQDWRNHLFNSLKCTGKLDSLKSQLRARLLDQLRDQDGTLLEFKGNRKPSVTERILNSLVLDYLRAYGYSFTQSVFLPESRAVSWPAFTFKEMSQLLHLDPTAPVHHCLKIGPQEKGCLAQQLVMVLQQMPFGTSTQDSSTQTGHHGSLDLDSCLREIDEICLQKKTSERQMTFRTLEERLNKFRQEFETRVNAEVALQVSRTREYETNAVRVEEEGRYRRQLARDCEELEQIHKTRLERIREREESLVERLVMKEKAIETSAYEQRQKLLASITDLRDREEKVKDKENMQTRLEDTLREKERNLRLKEEGILQKGAKFRAHAKETAKMRIKDLEEQTRSRHEQLQSERALFEVELAACKEDKSRLENEIATVRIDRELLYSLHERLASEENQRIELLERLALEKEQQKLLLKLQQHTTQNMEHSVDVRVEDTKYYLQNGRSDHRKRSWEEKSPGRGCKICRQQQRRWNRDQKQLQETIKHLEEAVQDAEDGKERANHTRRSIHFQLKSSDSELLETVTLLKKTQHALELERLHHYSLRSQIASFVSLSSQDKLQHQDAVTAVDHTGILANETSVRTGCGSVAAQKIVSSSTHLAGDPQEGLDHNWANSSQLSSMNTLPCTFQTKPKLVESSLSATPSTKVNKVSTAPSQHKEVHIHFPQSYSGTNLNCRQEQKIISDTFQSQIPLELADLEVVDATRKEYFLFHHDRNKLEPGSKDISWHSLDEDRKQVHGRQKGNSTSRSHQDKPVKRSSNGISSDADCSSSKEASEELEQILSRPSTQGVIPEAEQTTSADVFQEISQGRMNYSVMGSRSMRSNGSALKVQVNGKTVKCSSYPDSHSEEEREQTDIDILEMKFQKKVQVSGGRESEGYQSDEQGFWRQMCLECQAPEKEQEVNMSKLSQKTNSRASSEDIHSHGPSKVNSIEREKHMAPNRDYLQKQCIDRTQLKKHRLNAGDEALHTLSFQSHQNRCRHESHQCTLDQHHGIPLPLDLNDDSDEDKEVHATNTEFKIPHSTSVHCLGRISKETYASERLKLVLPLENLTRDWRHESTEDSFMDIDKQDLIQSSELIESQQQMQTTSHASKNLGDEDFISATPRELEEFQIVNSTQQGPSFSMSQKVDELHTECKQSYSSRTSQVSTCEPIYSLKKADYLEGTYSEESCSNRTRRASTVRLTPGVPTPTGLASKEPHCWEGQGRFGGNDYLGGSSAIQSEQGSYSPGDGHAEWIDDFSLAANADHVNDGDIQCFRD